MEGSGIVLHKTRVPEQVLIPEWLAGDALAGRDRCVVVAVDGLCQGVGAIEGLKAAFAAAGRTEGSPDEDGFRIVSVPDMLEDLWEDRPPVPQTPIITLGAELAGESRLDRIAWLRVETAKAGCDATLLTALDEIAWILNVRGSDIEYNPLVISYLLVAKDSVEWFVKKGGQPDPDTRDSFQELLDDGVAVLPYDDVSVALAGEMEDGMITRLAVDPATLNYNLYHLLKTAIGMSRCHSMRMRVY